MKKMKYTGFVARRGLSRLESRLDNPKNLKEIQEALISMEMSDVSSILTLKGLFDYNIPELYNKLVDSKETEGLWALLYKELFELLGYRVKVEYSANMDKSVAVIELRHTKYIITRTKLFIADINNIEDTTIEIKLSTEINLIYQEMIGFVHSIYKGNIEHYTIKKLDNIYENSKYSYLFK